LREELQFSSTIGVCSVADILHLTEDFKKGVLTIEPAEIVTKFQEIISEELVHITDLDKDRLSTALFERNENNIVTGLCEQAAKKTISPKRSIRLLSLKICDETSWWSETVQEEMAEYHDELE
jgi:hypothetical protein